MPYMIVERTGKAKPFSVYKRGGDGRPEGRPLGSHGSRASAQAQIAAVTINETKARGAADTYRSLELRPPLAVADVAATGLKEAEDEGVPLRAREIGMALAAREMVDGRTVRKMAAYHAAHPQPDESDGRAFVTWKLYGGAHGATWARNLADEMRRIDNGGAMEVGMKTLTAGSAGSVGSGIAPGDHVSDADKEFEDAMIATAKYAVGDEVFVKSVFDGGMIARVSRVKGGFLYTVKLGTGGIAEVTAGDISRAKAHAVKGGSEMLKACMDDAARMLKACMDDGAYDRSALAALHTTLGQIDVTGAQKGAVEKARSAIEQAAFSAMSVTKSGDLDELRNAVAPSLSTAVTAMRIAARMSGGRKGIAQEIIGTLRLDRKQRRGLRFEALLSLRDRLPEDAQRALWMVEAAYQTGKLNEYASRRLGGATAYHAAMIVEQVANAGCTTPEQAAKWLNASNYGKPRNVRERNVDPASSANVKPSPPRTRPREAITDTRDGLATADAPSVDESAAAIRSSLITLLRASKALPPQTRKAAIIPLRRCMKTVNMAIDPLQAQTDAVAALDEAVRVLDTGDGLVTAQGGVVEPTKAIKALVTAAAPVQGKPPEERIAALGDTPDVVRAVLQETDPERLALIEEALYSDRQGVEWLHALEEATVDVSA